MKSRGFQRNKGERLCTTIEYDVLNVEVPVEIQRIGDVDKALLLAVYFTQCLIGLDGFC